MKSNLKKKISKQTIEIAIKIFLAIFVFVFLMGVVYVGIRPYRSQLREGDISLRDVFTPFDFTYQGEIDEKATENLHQEALEKISPVYRFDSSKLIKAEKDITKFFVDVTQSRQTTEIFGDDEKLEALRSASSIKLPKNTLIVFIRTDKIDEVENKVKSIIYEIADRGILDKEGMDYLKMHNIETVTVYDTVIGVEEKVDTQAFLTVDKAKALAETEITSSFDKDRNLKKAVLDLTVLFLEPNLELDPKRTKKSKEETLSKISPVYEEVQVKKNELLVERGQRVSKIHLKKLDSLNLIGALRGKLSYLVGLGMLMIIFLILAIIYLKLYEPKVFNSNKKLFLIALNVMFIASVSEAIVLSPWSSYLIPVASVSMLLAILINTDVAFLVTILMSIFCGVIAGDRFGVTIVSLVGGCIGIYCVQRVRRRSQLFLAGLLVGVTNFSAIVGIGYLNNLVPSTFLVDGAWGFLSGFLSFFIVMGLLPILESLFKVTTDITLLELSDLNHPILKEMVMKAPGTYHHSLIVGNLAEAACDAVGANSLLARIGAYYHDIGKIGKSEYFSENETNPNSRHEGLTPSMSALIITSHVKDGVELAHKYKLSPIIINFIEQHHGKSLIYYFYQKALERGLDQKQLKEEEFRYPGPKPQTKEAATVLLADSVEASSRTLTNPIPSRIRGLVQRIINNKFIDNQLDECELTLKDLNKISDSFVRTLSGIFHTRVEYPAKEKEEQNSKGRNATNKHNKFNEKKDSSGSEPKEGDKKNT